MTDCTKVIVNNVVDGNEIYQNFYESFLGDEVELLVKKDGTLLDLKCEFEKEEGIEPARQRFFCGPVELEDDELPFYGLLELNNNTLDVVIPQASDPEVEVQADHNVWVVFGPSRNVFERIILAAGGTKTLTLTKGKLGIVTDKNVDSEGRNVYTVDRYKFQEEEEEITIVLKVEDGGTAVYKKMADDQEVRLPVQKSVVCKAMTRFERGTEKTIVAGKFLGNIGRFFSGVTRFASFSKLNLAKSFSLLCVSLQSRRSLDPDDLEEWAHILVFQT